VAAKKHPFFSVRCKRIGNHPEPFRCPKCGASYPLAGTCWGHGDDKHPASRVVAT
jgi:hypothetical protein